MYLATTIDHIIFLKFQEIPYKMSVSITIKFGLSEILLVIFFKKNSLAACNANQCLAK